MAHDAVAKRHHSPGVGGDHSADSRRAARSEIYTRLKPALCGGRLQLLERTTSTHDCDSIIGDDRFDLVEPEQRHHHLTGMGVAAADQSSASTLRHDRDVALATPMDDAGDFRHVCW